MSQYLLNYNPRKCFSTNYYYYYYQQSLPIFNIFSLIIIIIIILLLLLLLLLLSLSNYHYHHYHHHYNYYRYYCYYYCYCYQWALYKSVIKQRNKATQTRSLPKSNLLYCENLDLNLCNKKNVDDQHTNRAIHIPNEPIWQCNGLEF